MVTAKLFGVHKCSLTVVPHNGIGGVTFSNIGSGSTREGDADVEIVNRIHCDEHPDTDIGACSTGTASDGDSRVARS